MTLSYVVQIRLPYFMSGFFVVVLVVVVLVLSLLSVLVSAVFIPVAVLLLVVLSGAVVVDTDDTVVTDSLAFTGGSMRLTEYVVSPLAFREALISFLRSFVSTEDGASAS